MNRLPKFSRVLLLLIDSLRAAITPRPFLNVQVGGGGLFPILVMCQKPEIQDGRPEIDIDIDTVGFINCGVPKVRGS